MTLRLIAVVLIVPLASCVPGAAFSEGPPSSPLQVVVSIPPQAYLAERIGGESVQVQVLLAAGQEPHTFEPTPKQVMALGRADLYLLVGTLPFETRIAKKLRDARPGLAVVNTSRGVTLRELEEHGHHGAAEDEGREAGEHRVDPHIWLGPQEIAVQARNIAAALTTASPAHAEGYAANLRAFEKDLGAVDARLRKALLPCKGKTVFVFHPAFGYFLNTYQIEERPVEIHGKSPTPKQLRRLIHEAKEEGVKVLFVQPQFDKKSAEAVAKAIGGAVVPMDPLARDVLSSLDAIAAGVMHAIGSPDLELPAGLSP